MSVVLFANTSSTENAQNSFAYKSNTIQQYSPT